MPIKIYKNLHKKIFIKSKLNTHPNLEGKKKSCILFFYSNYIITSQSYSKALTCPSLSSARSFL